MYRARWDVLEFVVTVNGGVTTQLMQCVCCLLWITHATCIPLFHCLTTQGCYSWDEPLEVNRAINHTKQLYYYTFPSIPEADLFCPTHPTLQALTFTGSEIHNRTAKLLKAQLVPSNLKLSFKMGYVYGRGKLLNSEIFLFLLLLVFQVQRAYLTNHNSDKHES